MDDGFEQLSVDVFERYKPEGYSVSVRKDKEEVWQCDVLKDSKPLMNVVVNGWRKDLRTTIAGNISEEEFRQAAGEYFSNFSGEDVPIGEPVIDPESGALLLRSIDSGRSMSFREVIGEQNSSEVEIFVARDKLSADDRKVRSEINRLVPIVGRIHTQLPPIVTSNVYELARRELVSIQANPTSK